MDGVRKYLSIFFGRNWIRQLAMQDTWETSIVNARP